MTSPGPNSACPCGSGRKYKKCCKRADATAARVTPSTGTAVPPRSLQGTILEPSHPSHDVLELLLALDAAAGNVWIAHRDLGRSELTLAAARLAAAADGLRALGDASPLLEVAALNAVRAAIALAQAEDSGNSDRCVHNYFDATQALSGHIITAACDALTQIGVDHTSVPDFGTYWFSNATLSRRDGHRWLVVNLSIWLHPTATSPGRLFRGRATLWGLSHVDLADDLVELLEHDPESDTDPEYCLAEILSDIADLVEAQGI